MKRRTHKKPHLFDIDGESFKSVALGYLDAGQIMITHLPNLLKIFNSVKDIVPQQDGQAPDLQNVEDLNLDITKILESVPKNFVKEFTTDLLVQTYVQDVTDSGKKLTTYTLVNPQDFENMQECIKVCLEVFKHNFPDFFRDGSATEENSEQAEPEVTPEISTPKKSRVLL